MTQAPKFDLETVARIIDPEAYAWAPMPPTPDESRSTRATYDEIDRNDQAYMDGRKDVALAKAAAIMALHDADPARQMADAEAALWREHDARHAAELSRRRADLADAVGALEDALRMVKQYAPNGIERSVRFVAAAALLSRLKDAKP